MTLSQFYRHSLNTLATQVSDHKKEVAAQIQNNIQKIYWLFLSQFSTLPNGKTCYICRSFFGAVAQLVEQWTENPCVGGSIPPHTTNKPDSI